MSTACSGTSSLNIRESGKARVAIPMRKSTEHELDLEFKSLNAQREASEAYIKSQESEV